MESIDFEADAPVMTAGSVEMWRSDVDELKSLSLKLRIPLNEMVGAIVHDWMRERRKMDSTERDLRAKHVMYCVGKDG